jgi:TPP-dependent pyruvate/acetoin dehydrogenase alpha subunit
VLAVNDLTQKLVERARKGEGPFFMELMTYRYHGHHVGDINREYYRSKDERKGLEGNTATRSSASAPGSSARGSPPRRRSRR